MTGRRITLVRELADVCAARYREEFMAAMTDGQRADFDSLQQRLRLLTEEAFGDRCAWCGLTQQSPQADHYPPLVVQRMWSGYTMDICVPSCAKDNKQYVYWSDHLDACWAGPDRALREQHRSALADLFAAQTPVPRAVYEEAFTNLRTRFDEALSAADIEIAALAQDWVAAQAGAAPGSTHLAVD